MNPACVVDHAPAVGAGRTRVAADAAEPIRLLNVVPTLMCGGTENQFMALGRSLDPARFALEFACLRRWGGFVDEITARGFRLSEYNVTTFRSVSALVEQVKLARYIARHRIQIVHAYNFYGNVFAVPPARLTAPVVIASIRDRAPYLTPMQKRVQRYACRFADCVLVNADAVRDWLADDGYDASKIVVIRNGVDLARFEAPPDPLRLRHELGLAPETPLVAVVSRLTRQKGIESFLEAAAAIAARRRAVRFLIVGETSPMERPYLGELMDLADRLGVRDRVAFMGLRSDVPALLAAVNVSVMPSLNEALSNVVLESMAAGAPTVATRVGGTPEAIVDGVNGLLVPPADPPALVEAITRLLDNPPLAAAFGRAARRSIEERFSVERMVDATQQLYVDLLARKTHSGARPQPCDRRARALRDLAPAVSPCETEIVTNESDFLALEPEWNDAVERAGIGHPFLSHEWMRTWWECFGDGRRLHIVVVRAGGRIIAIAPLMRETVRMYGAPIRQIRMMQNDHTPRADVIVAERPDESYRAIWASLRQSRDRWDVLLLSALPRESPTREIFSELAVSERHGTGTWQSDASPYLTLTRGWNEYFAGLTAKFRSNVRNRLARLARIGEPSLEVLSSTAAIQGACADALRLEASGWKADAGTSVFSNAAVQRFYTRLAERATDQGWLRLLFLTVNGRRIATAYGAAYRNRLFLFKTGYDPSFATCSPFKLLTYFALQHAYATGMAEVDFLGDAESWKLEWTKTTRPHDWLFVFAGTPRGRLMHPIKFQLVPALKRLSAPGVQ